MSIYNKIRKRGFKILPRRFHCYCIGAAKTATTTISSMFAENYDSRHEANIQQTNHNIIRFLENDMNREEMKQFLVKRDKELSLEIESTHSLAYVSRELVELFPSAKFIVTVRDPWAWIHSRINFHYRVTPPEWEEYRQYFWMRNAHDFPHQESVLKENDLAPLDVYLQQYQQHYALLKKNLPEDNCLYLKTEEVSNSIEQLSEFLGISASQLHTRRSNTQANKESFIQDIDHHYLRQKVWNNCESFIREFYPETISSYD